MALTAGTTIGGRYRVLDAIGRGGMGEVHRALDERLDRHVAVKLIGIGQSQPSVTERFRREARALARISHPNAVAVHDFGIHDERPYIVMEMLEGIDLQRLLKQRGELHPSLVGAVASGMCEGLRAAHQAGVLHRDVKPSNVHLTRQGRVVLQDFGIAALLDSDTAGKALTSTGTMVGTPHYMAPETLMGAAPGPATDLYSVGVCMYEMLAGVMPFDGSTAMAVMFRTVHEGLPDIRTVVPGLPAELADLVIDLTRKDPSERPTADDTLARLGSQPDAAGMIASAATDGVRERALMDWPADESVSVTTDSVYVTTPRVYGAPPTTGQEWPGRPAERRAPEPETAPPASREHIELGAVTRQHMLSSMTPETAQTRLREAVGLVQRGELADAGQLLSAVHLVCRSTLGAAHPTTLAAHFWHGVCLSRLGASGEALTAFATVAERTALAVSTRRAQAELEVPARGSGSGSGSGDVGEQE